MTEKLDINRVAATAIETVLGDDHPKHRSLSSGRAVAAGVAVAAAALAARRNLVSPSRVLRGGEAVLSGFVDIDGVRDAVRDRLADAGVLVDDERPRRRGQSAPDEPEESDEDWEEDEDWDEEDDDEASEGEDATNEDDYDWDHAESEWDDAEADADGSGGRVHPAQRPPRPPGHASRRRSGGRER
jgi:hypothetical protein